DRFLYYSLTILGDLSVSDNNNYLYHIKNISSEINIGHFWSSVKLSASNLHSQLSKIKSNKVN
uniref:Glycosyltransferase family 2 protein n=1 Tax=Strongyloides papillosus TaxID=174720 RepID=A0A0N5B2V7_STREA